MEIGVVDDTTYRPPRQEDGVGTTTCAEKRYVRGESNDTKSTGGVCMRVVCVCVFFFFFFWEGFYGDLPKYHYF